MLEKNKSSNGQHNHFPSIFIFIDTVTSHLLSFGEIELKVMHRFLSL